MLLPVIMGIGGWLVAEDGHLLGATYDFFKNAKNAANRAKPLDEDAINDFITQFQTKLARIHQTLKLMFPGWRPDTKPILEQSDQLADIVAEMADAVRELAAKVSEDMVSQADADPLERDRILADLVDEDQARLYVAVSPPFSLEHLVDLAAECRPQCPLGARERDRIHLPNKASDAVFSVILRR